MATRNTQVKINLSDPVDRWRYVCPRGHPGWEPTNHHYWCANCARHGWDVDPEFHELHDKRDGVHLRREEVFLEGYDDA